MKICKYIVVITVFAIITLIIVHVVFLIPAPFKWLQANWTADGILAFLGAIVAAISTIFVFSETLKYNRKKDNDNKKFQIKPYLTSEAHIEMSLPDEIDNEATYMIYELSLGHLYATSEPPMSLTKSACLNSDNICTDVDSRVLKYILYNVGAGSAINIEIKIDGLASIVPFTLPINSNKLFYLIIYQDADKLIDFSIEFDFEYLDAATISKYKQYQKINFMLSEMTGIYFGTNVALSAPVDVCTDDIKS